MKVSWKYPFVELEHPDVHTALHIFRELFLTLFFVKLIAIEMFGDKGFASILFCGLLIYPIMHEVWDGWNGNGFDWEDVIAGWFGILLAILIM